jgi:uncharacterized membrane protein YeiH
MFDTVTFALDWLGIVAFAVTGALVASRKEMDLFGFALLATVTGIGGGTLRDLLLGVPVFWVREPSYLIVCVIVSSVMFFIAHVPTSRYRVLLWVDALGLALFAVAGAERALLASASPVVAVTMGVVTATFGGIIRDLLGGETPVILSREIYVSAALAGAVVFVAAAGWGAQRETALGLGFAVGLGVRTVALWNSWSLPRYKARPGRPYS